MGTAPLTAEQQLLAASGLDAARRSAWRRAPAVAALARVGLEDVRQEAYLAACLAARSFAGPGDFESYAAAAARNRLQLLLRRVRRTVYEEAGELDPPAPADDGER